MYRLTEKQKKAIPAILKCKTHASLGATLDAAILAIESAVGSNATESRELLEALEGLGVVETRTVDDVATAVPKVTWERRDAARAQFRSEANAWVESQIKALGANPSSIPSFEPGQDILPLTDIDIVQIAAGDTEELAARIPNFVETSKARG